MGFTRAELDQYRGATVPDLLPDPGDVPPPPMDGDVSTDGAQARTTSARSPAAPYDVRLLIVGINPSLWAAATGAHFARPGNRFYPALYAAGLTPYLIDASAGMRAEDRELLLRSGIGITNLVPRATARAAELTRADLVAGISRLAALVRRWRPRVVAVAGITAYRTAFDRPRARVGRQPQRLSGALLYVVPNPSGLNAHESIASLAEAYADAARAAGLDVQPARTS